MNDHTVRVGLRNRGSEELKYVVDCAGQFGITLDLSKA